MFGTTTMTPPKTINPTNLRNGARQANNHVRVLQSSAEMGEPGRRAAISATLITSSGALWVDRILERSYSSVNH